MRERFFLDRLRAEQRQLKSRITDLELFMSSERFCATEPYDRGLLRTQLAHMQGYLDILDMRLARMT